MLLQLAQGPGHPIICVKFEKNWPEIAENKRAQTVLFLPFYKGLWGKINLGQMA